MYQFTLVKLVVAAVLGIATITILWATSVSLWNSSGLWRELKETKASSVVRIDGSDLLPFLVADGYVSPMGEERLVLLTFSTVTCETCDIANRAWRESGVAELAHVEPVVLPSSDDGTGAGAQEMSTEERLRLGGFVLRTGIGVVPFAVLLDGRTVLAAVTGVPSDRTLAEVTNAARGQTARTLFARGSMPLTRLLPVASSAQ